MGGLLPTRFESFSLFILAEVCHGHMLQARARHPRERVEKSLKKAESPTCDQRGSPRLFGAPTKESHHGKVLTTPH